VADLGKIVTALGVVLTLVGVALWRGILPGRLPGDLAIQKPGFSLYFPLTTCLLLSAALSLLLWLLRR
jgi:hypothetical protein